MLMFWLLPEECPTTRLFSDVYTAWQPISLNWKAHLVESIECNLGRFPRAVAKRSSDKPVHHKTCKRFCLTINFKLESQHPWDE